MRFMGSLRVAALLLVSVWSVTGADPAPETVAAQTLGSTTLPALPKSNPLSSRLSVAPRSLAVGARHASGGIDQPFRNPPHDLLAACSLAHRSVLGLGWECLLIQEPSWSQIHLNPNRRTTDLQWNVGAS
jgi:hypothetical protein